MRRRVVTWCGAAAVGGLLLAGCTSTDVETGGSAGTRDGGTTSSVQRSTTTQGDGSDAEALAEARARWEDAGIGDYVWTVDLRCFCGILGPVRVTVQGGEVTEVEAVDPSRPPESLDDLPTAKTVEDLFTLAEDALASEDAGDVSITYDPELGYPTQMDIDWIEMAVDDEETWTASDLEPLT